MGLHVLEPDALALRDTGHCRHLVEDEILGLGPGESHLAPPETCQVLEARVGANGDALFLPGTSTTPTATGSFHLPEYGGGFLD